MKFFRNKFFLFLAFTAAAFFLSISIGGEYVHDHIHHHATQDEHDDCPVYQLLTQLFIFVAVLPIALGLIFIWNDFVVPGSFIPSFCFNLPYFRAPPFSL